MQVQIQQTDRWCIRFGDVCQLPRQVHSHGGGTCAARQPVYYNHRAVLLRTCAQLGCAFSGSGSRGGCANPLDCVRQLALGEGVGDEFIRTLSQQREQRCRRHIVSDQDHLHAVLFGMGDDLRNKWQIVLVGIIHCQGDKFHFLGFGLFDECDCLVKAQIAPAFA